MSTRKQQAIQESPAILKTEKSTKTRVVVKFDVGFGNSLFIRGAGANLSWEKGALMKNSQTDEWVWESEVPFTEGEFKVLINDSQYELGDNHPIQPGAAIQYSPHF